MRRFFIFVAMAIAMCAIPLGASAQVGVNSERMDPGNHQLTWTSGWTLDLQNSLAGPDYEGLIFDGASGNLFGIFVYANAVSGGELRDIVVDEFAWSISGYRTVDTGSRNGVHWELGSGGGSTVYAVFLDGELGGQSVGYFVVGPTASFANTVTTIQRDFRLNNGGVLNGVDGAGLQQRAQAGDNQVNVLAPSDSVLVYATEVGWTGPWIYDTSISSIDQAVFSQENAASGTFSLVSYGEFFDATAVTNTQALNTFATTFLNSFGAVGSQQLDSGQLDNGANWAIYRYSYSGVDLATFITVDTMSDGSFAVTTVTGNANMMTLTLIDVQEQFSLNRSLSLLDRVDPILVTLTLLI